MSAAELRLRDLWLAVGWLLVGVLLVLCLVPRAPHLLHFRHADKVEHAAAWALLMGWFMQIYAERRARLLVAFGLVAFGVAIEFLQLTTATRRFELGDMAADGLGVLVAWLGARPPLTDILCHVERAILPR